MKTSLLGAMILISPFVHGAETQPAKPAPSLIAASLFPDKIVARGRGVEVKQSQVEEAYLAFKSNRAAVGQPVPDEMRAKIEAEILDKLIITQLLLSRATDADKAKGKETGEKFIADQMKQAPSEESFNRQLRAMGMTLERFRTQVLEQAVVETVIDREIKSRKTVSDAEVKSYYDKNPALFQEPESTRVSHILFSTQNAATGREVPDDEKLEKKRLAEKVLAQAKTGAGFAGLVKQYSEDQASRERGGEYIIARTKDGRIRSDVPEFEAAAFSLAPNQISDIVTTRFGYHIIKGGEKSPAKKTEYAQVESKIKDLLLREQAQKELPDFVARLKKEAGLEILTSSSGK